MKEDMYVDWRRWNVLIIEVSFLLVLEIRSCIDLWIFSSPSVCVLHHCRTGGTSTTDVIEQLPVRAPVLEICQVGGKIQVIFNILLKTKYSEHVAFKYQELNLHFSSGSIHSDYSIYCMVLVGFISVEFTSVYLRSREYSVT